MNVYAEDNTHKITKYEKIIFFVVCTTIQSVYIEIIYILKFSSDKVLSLGTFTKQQDIISVLVQNTFGVRAQ